MVASGFEEEDNDESESVKGDNLDFLQNVYSGITLLDLPLVAV